MFTVASGHSGQVCYIARVGATPREGCWQHRWMLVAHASRLRRGADTEESRGHHKRYVRFVRIDAIRNCRFGEGLITGTRHLLRGSEPQGRASGMACCYAAPHCPSFRLGNLCGKYQTHHGRQLQRHVLAAVISTASLQIKSDAIVFRLLGKRSRIWLAARVFPPAQWIGIPL